MGEKEIKIAKERESARARVFMSKWDKEKQKEKDTEDYKCRNSEKGPNLTKI